MTIENELTNIFKATPIAEKKVGNVVFRCYDNRILHVRIPRFEKIDMAVIAEGYRFVDECGGGKFHNIYQFESFSDVEPDVREWASDSEGNNNTFTDAIVINSLSQKIIADFYLKFNNPIKPTKIFYSISKAAEWTLIQIAENTELERD